MKPKIHFYSHLKASTVRCYRVSRCGYWEDLSMSISENRVTKDACLVTCKKCLKMIA